MEGRWGNCGHWEGRGSNARLLMLLNNYVNIIMPKRVGWLEVVVVVLIIVIGVVMLIFVKLSACVC